jgi:hypothetical protein
MQPRFPEPLGGTGGKEVSIFPHQRKKIFSLFT